MQAFDRYAINLSDLPLDEARRWPDLLRIVEERVKPERDARDHNPIARRQKEYWWRYRSENPNLYGAIRNLSRCLVNSQVSKHLVFAFQPTDRLFSHALYVFAFEDNAHFAVMQSRIHEGWARLLSSSLEDRLRYAPSDCFETFPFPEKQKLASIEPVGLAFYEARAAYMKDENVGLTITYNRMKDSTVTDARIEGLRKLTIAMDRAVLAAYGWSDLEPPAFTTPVTDEDRRVQALFEDAVIDRLFALNAERARTQGAASRPAPDDDDETGEEPAESRPRNGRKAKPAPKKKRGS